MFRDNLIASLQRVGYRARIAQRDHIALSQSKPAKERLPEWQQHTQTRVLEAPRAMLFQTGFQQTCGLGRQRFERRRLPLCVVDEGRTAPIVCERRQHPPVDISDIKVLPESPRIIRLRRQQPLADSTPMTCKPRARTLVPLRCIPRTTTNRCEPSSILFPGMAAKKECHTTRSAFLKSASHARCSGRCDRVGERRARASPARSPRLKTSKVSTVQIGETVEVGAPSLVVLPLT